MAVDRFTVSSCFIFVFIANVMMRAKQLQQDARRKSLCPYGGKGKGKKRPNKPSDDRINVCENTIRCTMPQIK